MNQVIFWAYMLTILLTAVIAGLRYKRAPVSIRFICILLMVVPLVELLSIVAVVRNHSNELIYNLFLLTEFLLLCLYFHYSVDVFTNYGTGYLIASIGLVFFVGNILTYQPIVSVESSNFIAFQIVAVFGMCFIALYHLLIYHRESTFRNTPHYAIIFLLLLNWLVIFIHWGMGTAIEELFHSEGISLYAVIQMINILVSIGFSVVLIFIPKQFKYEE